MHHTGQGCGSLQICVMTGNLTVIAMSDAACYSFCMHVTVVSEDLILTYPPPLPQQYTEQLVLSASSSKHPIRFVKPRQTGLSNQMQAYAHTHSRL